MGKADGIEFGARLDTGVYSIIIPLHCSVELDEEAISLSSESDDIAINISYREAISGEANMNAAIHLDAYLHSENSSASRVLKRSPVLAHAEYTDVSSNRRWQVAFHSQPPYLVFITLTSDVNVRNGEAQAYLASFNSLRVKP